MAKYNQNESNRFNNQEIWQVPTIMVAYHLCRERRLPSEQTIYKVNIPALMPEISPSTPNEVIYQLRSTCFVNAPDCKLPINSSIETKNYISIPKMLNEHFNHKWLDHMAKISVEARSNDIDTLRVNVNWEDPSYCDDCISQHPLYYHS